METKILIDFSHDDKICTLRLNCPTTRNAISPKMIEELSKISDEISRNKDISVVILTGEGKAFCSGGNIKEMADPESTFQGATEEVEAFYQGVIQQIPRALTSIPVPTIAAINGPAIGAGFDIAMMCDLRIVSESATLSQSFVNLGLISGDGGAYFLPRLVGYAKACEIAFTGKSISAQQALQWGLVTELATPEKFLPRVEELALEIASHSREALLECKSLLQRSLQLENMESFLRWTARKQARLHQTGKHQAAIKRLLHLRENRE